MNINGLARKWLRNIVFYVVFDSNLKGGRKGQLLFGCPFPYANVVCRAYIFSTVDRHLATTDG